MVKGSAKAARRRERKKKGIIRTRKKKEFLYRGYTIEELKTMSLDQIIPLLPSRCRRSLERGLSEEHQKVLDKIRAGRSNIRTHRRDMIILPEMVGHTVSVHRGNEYKSVEIAPEMIGHFLGEFAPTRKFGGHTGPGVGATRSSKYMPLK